MTARNDLNTHSRQRRVRQADRPLSGLIMPAKQPTQKKPTYSLRSDKVTGISAGAVRNAADNR